MTTAGEGGMVTTNDRALWNKIWSYKDHGKSFDAVYSKHHSAGFRWLHESFGTNWRLTEMQSAIGLLQLERMPEWTLQRQKNSNRLKDVLQTFSCISIPTVPDYIQHAYYKFYAFINTEYLADGWDRDRVIASFNALGLFCMQGSCSEVYLEKAFDHTAFRPSSRLPMAKLLGEASLMFNVHPTISPLSMAHAVGVIKNVLTEASK